MLPPAYIRITVRAPFLLQRKMNIGENRDFRRGR